MVNPFQHCIVGGTGIALAKFQTPLVATFIIAADPLDPVQVLNGAQGQLGQFRMVFPRIEELTTDMGQAADQFYVQLMLFEVAGVSRVIITLELAQKSFRVSCNTLAPRPGR